MNQDEITKIYETLAPMAGDYANAQAEQIGQAQRSMGTLAGNTMGTATAGLGNYTYNRLMRPQVDTMRDTILTQGYANQLNRLLSDALRSARNNYNKVAGSSGDNKNSNSWSGDFEHQTKDESAPPGSEYDPNKFVKDGYEFGNYGDLMGYTGKYPLTVSGPDGTTSYQDYTSGVTDPQAKATKWYQYLKKLGYAG